MFGSKCWDFHCCIIIIGFVYRSGRVSLACVDFYCKPRNYVRRHAMEVAIAPIHNEFPKSEICSSLGEIAHSMLYIIININGGVKFVVQSHSLISYFLDFELNLFACVQCSRTQREKPPL